jgi:hypothetical protein
MENSIEIAFFELFPAEGTREIEEKTPKAF